MSYSVCLKCKKAVGWYDKYCPACQIDFGLPDLPDWQKENFTHENFDAWAKREVEKDLENKKMNLDVPYPVAGTSILKDKTCPKCGEPDALAVCATVGAVNCSCCFSFIRVLTKEEREVLIKMMEELKKKEKDFIHGNPKAETNYKIVGITDSREVGLNKKGRKFAKHLLKFAQLVNRRADWKFVKYVYEDVYKPPESVRSILKEEGLTKKQIDRCMRKRDKYLARKIKEQKRR